MNAKYGLKLILTQKYQIRYIWMFVKIERILGQSNFLKSTAFLLE